MIISDIQQGVRDLWEFLVPRVSILLSMGIITYFTMGHSLFIQFSDFSSYVHYLGNEEVKNALTFYGVDKLMPFITLFFIMLFLHASFAFLVGVGNMLPPQLSYNISVLFLKSDFNNKLARIWAANPNIQNIEDLCTFIIQTTEFEDKELSKSVWGIEYLKEERDKRLLRFSLIKFLILWTLILSILAIKTVPVRPYPLDVILMIFVILFMLGIFSVLHFYYAVQQLTYSELFVADMKVGTKTENANEDWNNSVEHFKEEVKSKRKLEEDEHWWKIIITVKYFVEYWWKVKYNGK